MLEWIRCNMDWVFSGIGITLLGIPIALFSIVIKFRNLICKFIRRKIFKYYRWEANPPIKNANEDIISVKQHPKDMRLSNDRISGYVEGENAFRQALYHFIRTEKGKYPIYLKDYGIEQSETIYTVTSQDEYVVQEGGESLSTIVYKIGKEGSTWRELYDIEENKAIIGGDITIHRGHLPAGTRLIIPSSWLND